MKKIDFCIIFLSVLIPLNLSGMSAFSADNSKKQTYQVHAVKAGDTLSKIAKRYYDDYSKVGIIANFNDIKDMDHLRVGQKIKIPLLDLEPAKKASELKEEDLGKSGQGGSDAFEEKSLNRGLGYSRLERGTVFFIIIYLLVMLFLILIKWKGMEDDYHPRKPEVDARRFSRRKWKM